MSKLDSDSPPTAPAVSNEATTETSMNVKEPQAQPAAGFFATSGRARCERVLSKALMGKERRNRLQAQFLSFFLPFFLPFSFPFSMS